MAEWRVCDDCDDWAVGEAEAAGALAGSRCALLRPPLLTHSRSLSPNPGTPHGRPHPPYARPSRPLSPDGKHTSKRPRYASCARGLAAGPPSSTSAPRAHAPQGLRVSKQQKGDHCLGISSSQPHSKPSLLHCISIVTDSFPFCNISRDQAVWEGNQEKKLVLSCQLRLSTYPPTDIYIYTVQQHLALTLTHQL